MPNYDINGGTLHTSFSEHISCNGAENIEFEKYTQSIVELPYGMQDIQENLKPNHPYVSTYNYRACPVLTKESETFLWDNQFKRESIGEEVFQTFGPAQKICCPSKYITATPPGKNVEISINSISRKTSFLKEMNKNPADYISLSSCSSSGSSYNENWDTLSEDHKHMLVDSYEKKIKSLMEEVPQSFNNGQMMCGPPKNWTGPPPGEGTEIFISKLPKKIDIEKLYNFIFSTTGFNIYTLRLMINISKITNRGYCFVRFYTKENAEAAHQMLDGAEIISGKMLRVSISVDNKRLILKKIPKNLTDEQIIQDLSSQVNGVKKFICNVRWSKIIYPSNESTWWILTIMQTCNGFTICRPHNMVLVLADSEKTQNKNRGFIFVDFEDHRSADVARRAFLNCGVLKWKNPIICEWVYPTKPSLTQVPKLFVRNLLYHSEEELRAYLLSYFDENDIISCRKVKDYAFIQFTNFQEAERATCLLNGLKVNDIPIYAEWAKPPTSKALRIERDSSI